MVPGNLNSAEPKHSGRSLALGEYLHLCPCFLFDLSIRKRGHKCIDLPSLCTYALAESQKPNRREKALGLSAPPQPNRSKSIPLAACLHCSRTTIPKLATIVASCPGVDHQDQRIERATRPVAVARMREGRTKTNRREKRDGRWRCFNLVRERRPKGATSLGQLLPPKLRRNREKAQRSKSYYLKYHLECIISTHHVIVKMQKDLQKSWP